VLVNIPGNLCFLIFVFCIFIFPEVVNTIVLYTCGRVCYGLCKFVFVCFVSDRKFSSTTSEWLLVVVESSSFSRLFAVSSFGGSWHGGHGPTAASSLYRDVK